MKKLMVITNIIIYLVAAFFILMSLDAIDVTNTFWENVLGFLIHASIGLVLLLINWFLRRKPLILGIILIVLSIFSFFFFEMYKNFTEKILILLVVFIPLLFSGIIHILYQTKTR